MSFIDLDGMKECLGIPLASTKEDARLNKAILRVNSEILRYLCLNQCDPEQVSLSVDLYCDDLPVDNVCIEPRPVISVDELTCKGTVLDPTRYRCRGTWVSLCSGSKFPCGCGCGGVPTVEALVTVGFDQTNPGQKLLFDSIAGGVMDYAIAIYKAPGGGFKSEKNGRFGYTRFSPSDLSGVNGPVNWPISLSTALGELYRPETGALLSVAC